MPIIMDYYGYYGYPDANSALYIAGFTYSSCHC